MTDDLVKRLREEFGDAICGEAADRIEALERERDKTYQALLKVTKIHDEVETKLAKAVEVAEKSIKWLRLYGADVHREATTLAELKGEK